MFTRVHWCCSRKHIQDLNWQRKNDQLTGGAKLRELESKSVFQFRKFSDIHLIQALIYLTNFDFVLFVQFDSWVSLVSKNYEIERAIVQLENDVGQLRQQQGEENKENIRQDF